jgi:hypothetical protein
MELATGLVKNISSYFKGLIVKDHSPKWDIEVEVGNIADDLSVSCQLCLNYEGVDIKVNLWTRYITTIGKYTPILQERYNDGVYYPIHDNTIIIGETGQIVIGNKLYEAIWAKIKQAVADY